MPAPYPRRSPVSMPGARDCRLARRLAAGLSPAEVAQVEATTEAEILSFLADQELAQLVRHYRAARALPEDEQERLLIETAMAELWNLIDLGDRRALIFIVYEANRGRHPARRLVQLVRRSFEQATEPRAVRPADPAPPDRHRDSMQGYGQHPLGPAHAAAPRLADFIGAEAGRAALRDAAREPAEAEIPASPAEAPAAEPAAPSEAAPAAGTVVWVPRHPGVPDLPDDFPDDPPLSPLAALARDNPEWAAEFIRRGEERLAQMGWREVGDGTVERIPGKKAQGP